MSFLIPEWPAPSQIRAVTTQRHNGHSLPPFDTNNLGLHVGDNPHHVANNRQALVSVLQLPAEPFWLEQTHSTHCVIVEEEDSNRQADAAISRSKQGVLAIMTADCLPILLCNKQGTEIAAIHAGWRGLAAGVIENTLAKLESNASDIMAWIGPSICGSCYEVGDEVRTACLSSRPFADQFFIARQEKWLADLPRIAEHILKNAGIDAIYLSHQCTYENINDYYSWRREAQTGRIASLIWFN